jgi:hypothetical protein
MKNAEAYGGGGGWAGIAQRYIAGLRAVWSGVRVPAECGNFSLHHRVQTCSGVHPASYPVGTRGSFPGNKSAEAWSWPLTFIYYRDQECVELYLQSPNTPSRRGAQQVRLLTKRKVSLSGMKGMPANMAGDMNMRHSLHHLRVAIKRRWGAYNCEEENSFENKIFIKPASRSYYKGLLITCLRHPVFIKTWNLGV